MPRLPVTVVWPAFGAQEDAGKMLDLYCMNASHGAMLA